LSYKPIFYYKIKNPRRSEDLGITQILAYTISSLFQLIFCLAIELLFTFFISVCIYTTTVIYHCQEVFLTILKLFLLKSS